MLVLCASSRRADWVGLELQIRVKLDFIDDPFMTKAGLSITGGVGGMGHISIKLWSEVVIGILSNVVPFGFGFFGTHFKRVTKSTLRDSKRMVVVNHIFISTEVGDKVVDVVASPH